MAIRRRAARRSPITPGSRRRSAPRAADEIPASDRRHHHRRDHRLRHGHRQAGRALRRPPQSAEIDRGLLSGDGPRRPRRQSRANAWMAYGLQDIVQLRQWIGQIATARKPSSTVQRQKLDALIGLARDAGLPAAGAARLLRRAADRSLAATATTASPRRARKTAPSRAEGAVGRLPHRPALRRHVSRRRSAGTADERVLRNGHDDLSVFGIGKDVAETTWKGLFRQLTAAGLSDRR